MWPATREGEICGKHPKTVMEIANHKWSYGRVSAQSWPTAEGRALAGGWRRRAGAGRGRGQSPAPARPASGAGVAPGVAARAEGDGSQPADDRLVPAKDGLVSAYGWGGEPGGVERLRAQALSRRTAGTRSLRQHHPRLLPGDQELCQLVFPRGVPGRPQRAPD